MSNRVDWVVRHLLEGWISDESNSVEPHLRAAVIAGLELAAEVAGDSLRRGRGLGREVLDDLRALAGEGEP